MNHEIKKRCGEICQNLSIILKHVCHRPQHVWFFYTLHKIHLRKLCRPCSSQSFTKTALSPGVKKLSDRPGLGQGRWVRTWNRRAPIEISAHSSSSKDSGALMTRLARKRRINSSISKGSSNLSHRVDKEKIRFINWFCTQYLCCKNLVANINQQMFLQSSLDQVLLQRLRKWRKVFSYDL